MIAPPLAAPAEAAAPGASPRAGRLRGVVRLAVSAGLVVVVLRSADLGEVAAAARGVDLSVLLLAFLLNFVGYFLTAQRWRTLLAAGGVEAPVGFLFRSCMVAMFFNNLLPSTIGGDAFRAHDSSRLLRSRVGAVAVILVDRLLGVLALGVFGCVALLLSARVLAVDLRVATLAVVAVAGGCALAVWALFLPPRWLGARTAAFRPGIERLVLPFRAFSGRPDALAKALAFSLALQVNVILQYFLVARALSIPVPLPVFFLIVPVALAVMALPISINAIGVREGVFTFLLGLWGVAAATSVAFAWLLYGIVLVHGVLGGVLYAARR